MSLLHQSLAISHPHSSTSQPPVRKQGPATTATLPQVPSNISPSVSSDTKDGSDKKVETDFGEKKVLGLFDDIPINGTFKVKDEVENFFKDQINAKITDFEDLKKQIAVLDRHLKKHSEFADFNATDNMLLDLDEKVLKPYEDGLKVLKNKIVHADHDNWSSTSVDMINTIVSKAEKFIDISYERVYGTLDDHLESDEHKNEHAHGHGHSEDHAADYADLLTVEDDELVDVSAEDEELLIEYIDMDIDDLENIIKQKDDLEHHIEDHFKLDNVESDELQLIMAENVLQNLDIEKLKAYEKSLKALKSQIKQSNGKLKLEMVDQISATMEKAEVFLDASQEKLKLVGDLDEEFEVFEEAEAKLEEFKQTTEPNENTDQQYSPVISNAIKKTTKDTINSKEESSAKARETYLGDSTQVLPGENLKQSDKAENILIGEVRILFSLKTF